MLKKLWLPLTLVCLSSSIISRAEEENPAIQALPIDELRLFSEVFHQIRTHYVTDVSDRQLLEYAIKGMLGSLDPHSAYLTKNDFTELQETTTGEFAGLGLEVIMENGFMKVVSPIDDTPAQKAGIRAGDIIIKINEQVVKGLDLNECIDMMRGKKGSKVSLTVMRDNETKPLEFALVRDIIRIQSVKSSILDKQWGYLRISQFQDQTGNEARQHLQKMLDDSFNQLQGLILDLRNNPGGVLHSAVDITDLFLKEGLIVYTKGRTAESQESYRAKPDVFLEGKPIVVLINSGSASASEIVAGALQDHRRALIAGTNSFGKGSVQIIIELPDNRGMKLTTARYYTPQGRSIQAEGINPDISIHNASLTVAEEEVIPVKEANLSKHLENKEKKSTASVAPEPDPLMNDYQLHEALNLLKAMKIAQTTR